MDKYQVKLMTRAAYDLEEIYKYIVEEFKEVDTAKNMIEMLEKAILSLDEMPYRGATRKIGIFANKGYHQLFVKNFTIVYKIDEKNKIVIVVTVKYTPSNF